MTVPPPRSGGVPGGVVPPDGASPDAGERDAVRHLVHVMDVLRSPGGCPWDAEQTHESLVPFVLEEAHELAEAIEGGDRDDLREELGDVLLQVVFHARVAQEHPTDPFGLDDVAAGLTAKLVRRHPHVFPAPGSAAADPGDPGSPVPVGTETLHARWDRIKTEEKNRTSVLDGIPLGQGALARGEKVLSRARRAGLTVDVDAVADRHVAEAAPAGAASAELGARLLRLVGEAGAAGVDAEAALRAALRGLDAAVRAAEAGRPEHRAD